MNGIQITAIVIAILFALIFIAYILSVSYLSKDLIILLISILFVISIFLNFITVCSEQFYFEVSPNRKKCLEEQVSLANYGKQRTCSCCQKGTVGGYPPYYQQWMGGGVEDSRWHRGDNWTSDKNQVTYIPPTEYVANHNSTVLQKST